MSQFDDNPEVTKTGALDMQVCVPDSWTDDEITLWANDINPAGTDNGWQIRKDGDKNLNGDPERATCSDKKHHVHIMLD